MCPNRLPAFVIFNNNMHTHVDAVIAHGGYMDTVRECIGSWLWEKNPFHTGNSNPYQYCTWLFSLMLYQPSYPCPTKLPSLLRDSKLQPFNHESNILTSELSPLPVLQCCRELVVICQKHFSFGDFFCFET